MKPIAPLFLVIMIALAGCTTMPTRVDPDASIQDGDVPPDIHDERTTEQVLSAATLDCEYGQSAFMCFEYPFAVEEPLRVRMKLSWDERSTRTYLGLFRGSESIAYWSAGGQQSIEVEKVLMFPDEYTIRVEPRVGFVFDAAFEAIPDPELRRPSSPLVHYLHDLSVPIEGVTPENAIVEQYRIRVDEGIHLDTWVARPDIDGPVPIILALTPYYGGGPPMGTGPEGTTGIDAFSFAHVFLPRGYAVAISSLRGTGNSEGCFTIGGPSEAKDSAVVIQELAAQPWSNGNVGVIGVSYDGTTAQDVWVEAPPALKTIVPISGISDLYKYNFVNGVPIMTTGQSFNTYYWALFGAAPLLGGTSGHLSIGALDPTSMATGTASEACEEQIEVQEAGASSALDGNKDAYWKERDFRAELGREPDKTRASVFYIHGLEDWNVKPHNMEDWVDAVRETGVPMKMWLGQWDHSFPLRDDWKLEASVAWFDQFLKGIDTGILDAPAVQVQDDLGIWRHETRWPPAQTVPHTLHPDGDGSLQMEPGTGSASYSDLDPYGTQGELDNAPRDMVVWESDVLPEDWHVSGQPVFEGYVTATAKRAAFMLTLIERSEAGDRAINYAAMSLNHVSSLESGAADISGKEQLVRVRFFPQDDVVRAGSRLLLVAAGNFVHDSGVSVPFAASVSGPDMLPASEGGMITMKLDGASLVLPLDMTLTYEDPQPAQVPPGIA